MNLARLLKGFRWNSLATVKPLAEIETFATPLMIFSRKNSRKGVDRGRRRNDHESKQNRNGPFAPCGYMVRNKLCETQITQWDFQNKGTRTSPARLPFVLKVPLRYLRRSVIYSVPCDRILQRAYSRHLSCAYFRVWNWRHPRESISLNLLICVLFLSLLLIWSLLFEFVRHRHVPKAVFKAAKEKKIMLASIKRKYVLLKTFSMLIMWRILF